MGSKVPINGVMDNEICNNYQDWCSVCESSYQERKGVAIEQKKCLIPVKMQMQLFLNESLHRPGSFKRTVCNRNHKNGHPNFLMVKRQQPNIEFELMLSMI